MGNFKKYKFSKAKSHELLCRSYWLWIGKNLVVSRDLDRVLILRWCNYPLTTHKIFLPFLFSTLIFFNHFLISTIENYFAKLNTEISIQSRSNEYAQIHNDMTWLFFFFLTKHDGTSVPIYIRVNCKLHP